MLWEEKDKNGRERNWRELKGIVLQAQGMESDEIPRKTGNNFESSFIMKLPFQEIEKENIQDKITCDTIHMRRESFEAVTVVML